MELKVEALDDGAVCVALSGRLDTVGVDQVETRFNAVAVADARDALIDMSGVEFVSSMGVRLLITAARAKAQRGRRLALFGLTPVVQQTLDMVALDQIIPIGSDLAEARTRLAG